MTAPLSQRSVPHSRRRFPEYILIATLAALPALTLAETPASVRVLSTTPDGRDGDARGGHEAAAEIDLEALVAQLEQSAGAARLAPARGQVTVRGGETLLQVVRRTLPNTPLKEDILRQAFERLNPELAEGGRYRPLRAGMRLTIPSPGDLRQSAVARYPEAAGLFLAPAARPGAAEAAQPAAPAGEKPRWVRFPG